MLKMNLTSCPTERFLWGKFCTRFDSVSSPFHRKKNASGKIKKLCFKSVWQGGR